MKFVKVIKADKYLMPNSSNKFEILDYVKKAMKSEGYSDTAINEFVSFALSFSNNNYFKDVIKSKINELNGKNFFGDKLIEY